MKLSVTLNIDGSITMTNPDKWDLIVGETVTFVPEAKLQAAEEEANAVRYALNCEGNPVNAIEALFAERDLLQAEVARLRGSERLREKAYVVIREIGDLVDRMRPEETSFTITDRVKEMKATIAAQAEEIGRLTGVYILGNRDLRARVVELETAILNWYEWSGNDSINDDPLGTINEIALLMLDQEPKVKP